MPELPEVETIRSGLCRFVLNKEIKTFIINDKKLNLNLSSLRKLRGDSFSKIERLGKMLVFSFNKHEAKMLVHLKMTGQLIFCRNNKLKVKSEVEKILLAGGHSGNEDFTINDLKYVRFQIFFSNGYKLVLNDARRFAYVKIVGPTIFALEKKRFGLEPLSTKFIWKNFSILMNKHPKRNIKAFLLDQGLIAGIGNIYADETLFASGVNPQKKVGDLNEKQKKIIFQNIKRILKLAVKKRGTTFSNYVDAKGLSGGFSKLLKVYNRDGDKCYKCGRIIKKTKIAGRGTHFCSYCQK